MAVEETVNAGEISPEMVIKSQDGINPDEE
jgi:hypothetical protein